MRRRAGVCSIAAVLLTAVSADGATISVAPAQDRTLIFVSGEFQLSDWEKFADASLKVRTAVVVLESPGGNLISGIEIGRIIRNKKFATLVLGNTRCASACA
jgi:hypothetical protein